MHTWLHHRPITLAQVVKEIAQQYRVSLKAQYKTYPVSDPSVKAVATGRADATDPFNRQWTLVNTSSGQEVRRRGVTPTGTCASALRCA